MFYSARRKEDQRQQEFQNFGGMQTTVMNVTPEVAKTFLGNNTNNRKIRKTQVAQISGVMKRGEWKLSPQGIIVHSPTGRLLDGQHRLLAVVDSGINVPMMVTFIEDEEVFRVLDQGVKRSTADIFAVPTNVADTVNFLCRTMLNRFSGLTPSQIEPVLNSQAGALSFELVKYCSTSRRGLSSSPVKAAAVTSVLLGNPKDYVFSLYRDLVMYNIDSLPSVGKAFIRQIGTGSIDFTKGGDHGSKNTYARCVKLFDKENSGLQVIRQNMGSIGQDTAMFGKRIKDVLVEDGSLPKNWPVNTM